MHSNLHAHGFATAGLHSGPHILHLMRGASPPITVNALFDAGYNIVPVQRVDIPFIITPELAYRASMFTHTLPLARARELFVYLTQKIEYGDTQKKTGYASSEEVWKNKQGVCGEMTYLYVSMARFAGLSADYVSVTKDVSGKRVSHACALVRVPDPILVDIAYQAFDVKHIRYEIKSDQEASVLFRHWRG